MARAIWTGTISFGLVAIPVRLLPAVHADEDVHFHYLHAKDEGRIKNVRRCEVCGKEIPWSEIARGFEYEKGSYVVVTDEELASLRTEISQSVAIEAFVDRAEIDPRLFDVPYYLEPEKRGRHAYALLRDILERTGKVGIAQVALRTRAHLAVLRPAGKGLVIELLRYPHEVASLDELDLPPAKEKTTGAELKAAESLVAAMTRRFDPQDYRDEYEARLRAALAERARHGARKRTKATPEKEPAKVVDLVSLLKRSLDEKGEKAAKVSRRRAAGGTRRG